MLQFFITETALWVKVMRKQFWKLREMVILSLTGNVNNWMYRDKLQLGKIVKQFLNDSSVLFQQDEIFLKPQIFILTSFPR